MKSTFFGTIACCPPLAAGLFSRFRLRGTQELRPCSTAHVWAPAELYGACSGRSKSRESALFQGIAFRPAEPKATAVAPQVFPFVTAINGASACVCV